MSAFSFFASLPKPRTTSRKKNSPLHVETLEDRSVPAAITISGFVYHDANNNGLMDPGESPFANNPIELHNAANQIVASTTTDANGHYSFNADQTINQTPLTLTKTVTFGPTPTDLNLQGMLDQFDPSLGTLQEIDITHAGSITSDIKVENTSTTSGSLINGTVSGNLTLTAPGGVNDKLSISQYAGTFNAASYDGQTDFTGPSGSDFGQKTANGQNNIVLTGGQMTAYMGTGKVQVSENGVATSTAAGGGNVMVNVKSTGEATVTVVYKYIASNNLQPGDYTIVETQEPPGTFPGKNSSNGVILNTPPGVEIIPVHLVNNDSPNNDFGKLKASSLAGTVYVDANDNGSLDAAEPGIGAVSVTLTGTDVTGTAIHLTTTTDGGGNYKFDGLRQGTYSVIETQPAGYLDGATSAGSAGGSAINNEVDSIALPPSTDAVHYNFGEIKGGSLAGFVYFDTQNDGTMDPGDPGITNVLMTLTGTDNHGNSVNLQTVTDANGAYQFTGLRAGTYTISETQPAGYLNATNTAGNLGGNVNGDVISAILLGMGQAGTKYNFGEKTPPTSDLGIVKTASVPVSGYGDQLTYTLRVTNYGAGDALGVVVNDLLPPGETYVSASGNGWTVSQANGTITALRPSLAVGATSEITVIVKVPSYDATLTNFSQVSSTTPDNNPSNNTSSVTTIVKGTPGIVTKTDTPPLAVALGMLPIISKNQLMANVDLRNLDPNVVGKMATINAVYQTLTGSGVDASTNLQLTQSLLNGTTSQTAIVQTAWASDAHRALQAQQLYQTYLGRSPTTTEQAAVVQALQAGATVQSQAAAILSSPSYQQLHANAQDLATALSQDILGQTPNSVSAQTLVQSLGNQTLAQAVDSLLYSSDGLSRAVDQTFRNTVRRPATAAELAQYTAQLQAGTITTDALAQQLLSSQEFFQVAYNALV